MINNIHEFAANQITAEGNGTFEVLMTESIQNLIRKYKNSIPNTVIMGDSLMISSVFIPFCTIVSKTSGILEFS